MNLGLEDSEGPLKSGAIVTYPCEYTTPGGETF